MKLTNSFLTTLSILSTSSAFLVPPFKDKNGGDLDSQQIKFEIPSELGSLSGLSSYANIDKSQVIHIMQNLATELGHSWHDIPSIAIDSWYQVLKSSPQSFPELYKQLTHQLKLSKKFNLPVSEIMDWSLNESKSSKVKKVDWEHVVTNGEFPAYNLKVKNPASLGIDKVKQYSGYLNDDEKDKHYFYWFFESRNDPKNDPVILWLNGGPGCSSLTGLFFENGPASISPELKPIHNPHSWNANASVIFLDQPVNTGFSYSDSSTVSDTVTAGKDVYVFLSLFFQQFPEYNNLPFHIAGESYAGHYIPVFASEILSHDDRNFDLTSVLIGNGLTDPLRQYDFYEPMACGKGGEPPVLSQEECEGMVNSQPRCDNLINACYNSQSAWTCVPATVYCNNAMMGPYQRTGKNVYDIRTNCEGGSLCYAALDDIDKYLNLAEVKSAIGAEVEEYASCNFDTNRNFVFAGDWMKPYQTAVTNLLEQDIPVLIYAGDKDFICNWLGNENWSKELEWSGHEEFKATPLEPWKLDGKEVGEVRNSGSHFTFLRIYGAGHMAPFDQPEASLDMVNRWISGDFAFK